MSFINPFKKDKSAKRAARAAATTETLRLAEAQRLEGIETKKADELKLKTEGQAKRRLRRRSGGGGTTFTSPLGVGGGGGGIDSKVLLGL